MSSKLNSCILYAYVHGGAAWGMLTVKADKVLFAGNTVWSISEHVRGAHEHALYKSTLPLPIHFTCCQPRHLLQNVHHIIILLTKQYHIYPFTTAK